MLDKLQKETKRLADPVKAKSYQWFFKTGKGEYGEGDKFYGIPNPVCHKLSKKYKDLKLSELQLLISSKIHEERLIALLILVLQFQKGDNLLRKNIFNFYLKNIRYINNWDLVDLSAHKIVGQYLLSEKDISLLKNMALSRNIWEKRISIISTFAFIGGGSSKEALELSEILVNDSHDLIHKPVGWALREVGKRVSMTDEKKFLNKYASTMPRTMLRYAIERFPENLRKEYLNYGQRVKQRATSSN